MDHLMMLQLHNLDQMDIRTPMHIMPLCDIVPAQAIRITVIQCFYGFPHLNQMIVLIHHQLKSGVLKLGNI